MFGRVGSIGGAIVLLIALLAGIGNIYLKKSRVGEEYRKEAHMLERLHFTRSAVRRVFGCAL